MQKFSKSPRGGGGMAQPKWPNGKYAYVSVSLPRSKGIIVCIETHYLAIRGPVAVACVRAGPAYSLPRPAPIVVFACE